MSDTEKRPYAQVLHVANCVADALESVCHRVEIAGSLRREKAMVGDIEIVAIPKMHTNLIGDPLETSYVDDKLADWPVTMHKNGPKLKAFTLEWTNGALFKVDLFLQPDPSTWGVNFLLRTGSPDFSHRMVTPRACGGYKPEWATIEGARVWRDGVALPSPEERDVFMLWQMDYVEPRNRA